MRMQCLTCGHMRLDTQGDIDLRLVCGDGMTIDMLNELSFELALQNPMDLLSGSILTNQNQLLTINFARKARDERAF